MTNKITKKEFFGMLKGVVESSQPANMTELIAFIDHEVELIDRKAENRKAGTSKKAEANNALTTTIIEELAKIGKCTITDLLKKSEVLTNYVTEDGKSLSNQKISALLKPLYGGDNPIIERTMEKKMVYFRVIE
jgi:ERCC4-type nuclease